jgi:hypothetical protein
MLNLSFYSDDWCGYTRLLRDKQAKGDPTGAICTEEAPCLPTAAEINLNEKTNFNLYSKTIQLDNFDFNRIVVKLKAFSCYNNE